MAGLAAVLAASATAYTAVKLAGALYLVVLGVQALIAARRGRSGGVRADAGTVRPPVAHRPGDQHPHPKGAVFYTGLLPTLAPHGLSLHTGMALLVLVHVALTVVWLGGDVLLPSVRRGVERISEDCVRRDRYYMTLRDTAVEYTPDGGDLVEDDALASQQVGQRQECERALPSSNG
ncbi:hypothetical protein [Streptomyces sp. JH14]|uniref:LysE family translocator n=1 Tax=Streptomyces sp. JH14 TaxID=2793630 RepID=UPI003211CE4E